MMTLIIIAAIYISGVVLSYYMMKTEVRSERHDYTYGLKAINMALSVLSWIMILIILVNAWIKMISLTGYWKIKIDK